MLDELEKKRVEKALAVLLRPRTTPHVMSGGEVGFRIKGHEVLLYTARPHYREPDAILEMGVAKFRFVRTTRLWNLYWHRASGKWQGYEPFPASSDFGELVQEVLQDPYGCFWG
jgi:hypothetical protein